MEYKVGWPYQYGVINPYYVPPTEDNTPVLDEDNFQLRPEAKYCFNCKFEETGLRSKHCAWCKRSGNTVSGAKRSGVERRNNAKPE